MHRRPLLLSLLLLLLTFSLRGQPPLPCIRATAAVVDVRDGPALKKGHWSITPALRPDVYTSDRFRGKKRVAFYTDLDSVSFDVVPGKFYDFGILIGRDTAFTRISTFRPDPVPMTGQRWPRGSDTVPFTFGSDGKIYVQGRINGSRPLRLMLDLGSNQVVLSRKVRDRGVPVKWTGETGSRAFGGTRTVRSSSGNRLQVGALQWSNLPVVAIDGADGDGILGYHLFDGRVTEFNYERKELVLHPPGFTPKGGRPLPIHFREGLMFFEAALSWAGGTASGLFELDGGSNGALWINQDFAAAHRMNSGLEVVGTTTSHGLGGSVENRRVSLPAVRIGEAVLRDVPADIEQQGEGAGLGWGIFGMDVLMRFNTVLDLREDSVYFEPNTLLHTPYRKVYNWWMVVGGGVVVLLIAAGVMKKVHLRRSTVHS